MTTATLPVRSAIIRCPRCQRPLELETISTSPDFVCPLCSRPFEAVRFDPPVRAAAAPQTIGATMHESQPCAAHPLNAAVTSCDRCGAFMCALCRIDLDRRTLCPTCFERLSSEGALESTRTTFRDFPGLAGVTATFGCLLVILGVLFGPLAIYYGVKALQQKKKMGESDGLVGVWAAIVLGGLECVAGIYFAGIFIMAMFRAI